MWKLHQPINTFLIERVIQHNLARDKPALFRRDGVNAVGTGEVTAIDGKDLHGKGRIQRQHVSETSAFSSRGLSVDALRPHLRNSSMRARIASASSSR